MNSSLSATRFVKNNKRKVGVIVASLSIALAGLYLIAYFLNSVVCTYGTVVMDNAENVVFWFPTEETAELNGCSNYAELAELAESIDGVKSAIYTQTIQLNIIGPLGNVNYSQPLYNEVSDIEFYLDTIDAKIVEGRMPSEPGDILISADTLKMNNMSVGDAYMGDIFGQGFRIVGALEYSGYGLVGLTNGYMNSGWAIIVLVDDIKDMNAFFEENGIVIYDPEEIGDYKANEKFLHEGVIDIAEAANVAIFAGLTAILAFSVLIVFISFIRERQTEWCLYRSIGYSKMDIFLMVLKELLIIIGLSVLIGGVVGGICTFVMDDIFINSLGYAGNLWLPSAFPKMLTLLATVLGVTQIPILYTIHNVGTIDKVEE